MSTSNIVPYYSSSPPPLDEDDDTAHSLDADDDEFGDFSSAPAAKKAVDITTLKMPADESVVFRPISKNLPLDVLNDDQFADGSEIDEPPPIFDAKSEPVNFLSPAFTSNQFPSDHRKDSDIGLHSISAEKEQDAINENADNESKISSETNCLRETNNMDEQQFEKTSDLSISTNFASFDGEFVSHCDDPVKNETEEGPVVHDVLSEQHSFTDFASVNVQDTLVPDSLKESVQENFGSNSVQVTNKDVVMSAVTENVAEDEFDDFESIGDESTLKDNPLESVVSEITSDGADVSVKEVQENVVGGVNDEECNVKTMKDFEEFKASDEFDDFESFQDEFPVKTDPVVTKATSVEAEMSVNKVQDDLTADAPTSKCKINAMNDLKEVESTKEFDAFESCQDEFAVKDNQLDSVVSKADSDNAEISVKRYQEGIAVSASGDDVNEFEEFKDVKESIEDISFENVSENELETPNIEAVQSRKSDEKTASLANAEQNEKCDFDEYDEFQFASDEAMNSPATTGHSTAVSTATTFKTDVSSSSWSAFSKESSSDETNENSWAAFKSPSSHVVTNASSDLQTEKQATTITAREELKTPATAWKDSSTKTTAEGSQVKFDTLTSRVVTNCYPLMKEMDTIQLQFLLDVISQPQELTDNSAKSFHTQNMDLTTRESKSCLPDLCVWNNLKMMDLTSAFNFQWPTSSISRNLLSAINVDLSSILVGHKKPQAPLFAPNLGLLEPMKAPTELQITQADKDPLTFPASDSSSSSSAAMSSAISPQDVPQLEFDWSGSGLTNPLESTEKERELLDALEPPASDLSKMPPMSLETMMATLLPSIPSTQLIPKPQKDVDRKHLSKEAIQVLSKLPDLSFMQATVLMFPLKDIASN